MNPDLAKPGPSTTRQLCTFWVSDLLFGVDISLVQEVSSAPSITPLPLAHPAVSGLINLRGQIVTAIDLRRQIGLAPTPGKSPSMSIILLIGEGIVSLLVDEIDDVIDVDSHTFSESPEFMTEAIKPFIDGVYRCEPRLLLLLKAERIVRLDLSNTRRG